MFVIYHYNGCISHIDCRQEAHLNYREIKYSPLDIENLLMLNLENNNMN